MRLVVMLRRVPIRRVVAAAHVTTAQAQAQMHPFATQAEAFLTAIRRARAYIADLSEMRTRYGLLSTRRELLSEARLTAVGSSGMYQHVCASSTSSKVACSGRVSASPAREDGSSHLYFCLRAS